MYLVKVIPRDRLIFFFNDTATTEIYTLSLHDALPILLLNLITFVHLPDRQNVSFVQLVWLLARIDHEDLETFPRSEKHTSELQSRQYLVCRLLLEKKKTTLLPRSIVLSHFILTLTLSF